MCSGNANPVVRSFGQRCLGLYSVQQDAGCLHIGNHVHELQQCYAVECPPCLTLPISVQSKPTTGILTQLRVYANGAKRHRDWPFLASVRWRNASAIKNHCFASLSLLFADSLSSGSSLMCDCCRSDFVRSRWLETSSMRTPEVTGRLNS